MLTLVPPTATAGASDAVTPTRRRPVPRIATWVLVGLLAGGVALWSSGRERRALERLDPAARSALLARTVADLRAVCRGDGLPTDWCRRQADFALLFDECDGACRATAHEVLRAPTR
jgi:hypothetical protein